ncbi:hypothetical protein NL676_035147 [Syzygium grande]|nr:hypothetical protein NL676_035147 [Syzygium grande]
MKMYRKVFKAEFEFPPWFSTDTRRLVSRLLVSDPEKRITIPAIMRNPWFRKVLPAIGFLDSDPGSENPSGEREAEEEKLPNSESIKSNKVRRPRSSSTHSSSSHQCLRASTCRASSRQSGRPGPCSPLSAPATSIMSKIEGLAKGLSFKVASMKDFKIRLQGPVEGRKGRLSVTAEVFGWRQRSRWLNSASRPGTHWST